MSTGATPAGRPAPGTAPVPVPARPLPNPLSRARWSRAHMVLWQVLFAGAEALVIWQHWLPAVTHQPVYDGLKLGSGVCELTVNDITVKFGLLPMLVWFLLRVLVTWFGLRHWPRAAARSDRFQWRLAVAVVAGLFLTATGLLVLGGGLTYESGACSWWPPGHPVPHF